MRLYVMQGVGGVKIGIAGSPLKRCREVTLNGKRGALLVWQSEDRPDARKIETAAHSIFAAHRIMGEWFNVRAEQAVGWLSDATKHAPIITVVKILAPDAPAEMSKSQFIEFIRKSIGLSGLTASKFAAEIGVSAPYISDVLCGRREPGPAITQALGYAPHVSYGYK